MTTSTQIEMQKEPMFSENKEDNIDTCKITKSANLETTLFSKYLTVRSQLTREFLAEMLGTFILVLFINGAVAQNVFNTRDDTELGNALAINITCGIAVTMAILVVGKVSGAHLNPAVSLSMLMLKKMSNLKFVVYVIAQMIGAFLGAFAVYLVYYDMIHTYENTLTLKTASIFATYPNDKLSMLGGMFDQLFSTSLLIVFVLAVTDKKNEDLSHGAVAVFVGMAVVIIGTSFGYNCGYAINPARDLGPRLMTFVAGWGPQVFTAGNFFFITPILGPMLGAFVGTVIYYVFIGNHFPYDYKKDQIRI